MSGIQMRNLLTLVLLSCTLLALGQSSVPATQWVEIPLPPQVEYLTALSAGSDFLFASMRDSSGAYLGLFRTPLDGPGLWEPLGLEGLFVKKVVVAGESDMELLAATTGETQLYYSSNGGIDWIPRDSGVFVDYVLTLAWNGELPGRVYASGMEADYSDIGIFASTDFGLTWEYWQHCSGCVVSFVFLATPQDGGEIARTIGYTGFFDSHPYETRDGGQEWVLMDYPLQNYVIPVDLEISPVDPEITYFVSQGKIEWWEEGILKDGVPTPFSRNNIGMVTPHWNPSRLYVAGVHPEGGEDGPGPLDVVWTESLDDPNWASIGEGLPEEWSPSPNYEWDKFHFEASVQVPMLFLSAWGMGLWMRDMSDAVAVQDEPHVGHGPRLSHPWPNPTASGVTCTVHLQKSEHLRLRIFDVRGQSVEELFNGPLPAGVHTFHWRTHEPAGGQHPCGVYYLRLDAGGISQNRKIHITR